jgi:class 3 adenylate cyclase
MNGCVRSARHSRSPWRAQPERLLARLFRREPPIAIITEEGDNRGMGERQPCPGCGHDNEIGQSFCGACGNALVVTCARCRATSPPAFKFCGNCGAQLRREAERQPSREERRVVTVMFADLVGFTARAAKLDPEDVRAMLTPYYASLRDQIESFGGTVEKFIGDAVVGVFGAPVAHGDDPERAVRAALQIRDRVGAMRFAESGGDLEVRIGVNTGEAIVALDARADEGEGMVAGDVVNTAARLQTAAPTNAILVGEETYRCTCTTIDYDPLEPLTVKGKELPVVAWRVRGAPRPPGDRAAPNVPMVGRERELETLDRVWRQVVADRQPHLVTIFGLPGVGKSRLTGEFMQAVGAIGARVVFGRSLPYGESSAYDAFAQQIGQVAGIIGGDTPEVAVDKLRRMIGELIAGDSEEIVAHLAIMLGLSTDGLTTDEAVKDRQVLFHSARIAIQAIANAQPTVLVFGDLHWADSSLLDLIEMLASRVDDAPLLLLTAARPELEAKRPGWGALRHDSISLALEPLGREHSRELADRLLANAPHAWGRHTADEIIQAGEGNPLFIEELVASVAERSAPTGRGLPTSIRGIIAARLDAVPAPERSVLLAASVVGRTFWSGAIARLFPDANGMLELLDSLEARDLVRREAASRFEGQHQFRFKHSLIRDVAYAALPRARRRDAHAEVAAFFEEVHAGRDSPAALGHHWLEAGDRDRAADYFSSAAEQASRGWAKAEAVALYKQALTLIPEDDLERRRTVRLKLAVAQQTLYHFALSDADAGRQRPGSGHAERPAR